MPVIHVSVVYIRCGLRGDTAQVWHSCVQVWRFSESVVQVLARRAPQKRDKVHYHLVQHSAMGTQREG